MPRILRPTTLLKKALTGLEKNVRHYLSLSALAGMYVVKDLSSYISYCDSARLYEPKYWLTAGAEYAKAYNGLSMSYRAGAFYGLPMIRASAECFLRALFAAKKDLTFKWDPVRYKYPDTSRILKSLRRCNSSYLTVGDFCLWDVLCVFSHCNPGRKSLLPNAAFEILLKLEVYGEEGTALDDEDYLRMAFCCNLASETIAQLIISRPYDFSFGLEGVYTAEKASAVWRFYRPTNDVHAVLQMYNKGNAQSDK